MTRLDEGGAVAAARARHADLVAAMLGAIAALPPLSPDAAPNGFERLKAEGAR